MECHNQETMALLWKPDSWSLRLAELQAASVELKEAPLRRDVRSLGMLLGEVLREQAGAGVYEAVEELRTTAIARREALEERPREGRRRRAPSETPDGSADQHMARALRRIEQFNASTA